VLRYKEKEDIEARYTEVDRTVEEWRKRLTSVPEALTREFRSRLRISLIYHDAALEGDVLSYSEIKAAIDPTIISDTSLIPSYEDIKRYNDALESGFELVSGRNKVVKLDTIKDVYGRLADPTDGKGTSAYRKENPLHRLYYHDIAPPEKINYRMRKFSQFLGEAQTRQMHPVERVARTHHTLMAIFPWAKETGRCARIISNVLLRQADYPLAVIHSIDRQRYYEALRTGPRDLMSVYLEAVETTAVSEMRVYDEALVGARRRKRA
jgi:Fic family protein